jgi:hypothetical protein
LPLLSGEEKPATPLVTPHLMLARCLTAVRVCPARAGEHKHQAEAPNTTAASMRELEVKKEINRGILAPCVL